MIEPAAVRSRGPEDHFCHVWPVPGTSLPAEMNACVLSIMGAAELRTSSMSFLLSCWESLSSRRRSHTRTFWS